MIMNGVEMERNIKRHKETIAQNRILADESAEQMDRLWNNREMNEDRRNEALRKEFGKLTKSVDNLVRVTAHGNAMVVSAMGKITAGIDNGFQRVDQAIRDAGWANLNERTKTPFFSWAEMPFTIATRD